MVMGTTDPARLQAELESAVADLRDGRPADAKRRLDLLSISAPQVSDIRYFLGLACERSGDIQAAEQAFRKAADLERGSYRARTALADFLIRQQRFAEAEKEYRAVLRHDQAATSAAAGLGEALLAQGRAADAVIATARLASQSNASELILAMHASALKATGAGERALAVNERAVRAYPQSAIAEHNLASTLGDLAQHGGAEQSARRALAKGLDVADTHLVLARALTGLGRFEEAEAVYYDVLRRSMTLEDAQRELAQLVWMRTGDAARSTLVLDDILMRGPHAGLSRVKAKAQRFTGDPEGGYETLRQALAFEPDDVALLGAAAQAAAEVGKSDDGIAHAEKAVRLAPDSLVQRRILAEAQLAAGDAVRAVKELEGLSRASPNDQTILALLGTGWRMLGDERYRSLFDYDAFVRPAMIETPPGWSRLEDYLHDLALALRDLHRFEAHPFDQSVRGGSQATDLLYLDNPAIAGLQPAFEARIGDYLAGLGKGGDPMRRRITGKQHFAGMWTVWLRPNGFHVSHVHQKGWISSAFYVETVSRSDDENREGWLSFGAPGVRVAADLPAEHFIEPKPGMLVLFPSYMWHGTVPFPSGRRLSVAFDVVPD